MIDLTRHELLIAGAIGSMSLSLRALAPRSVATDDGTPVATELPAYTDYRAARSMSRATSRSRSNLPKTGRRPRGAIR